MKSKQIAIIVMAVLLAALVAVYFLIGANTAEDGETQDTQSTDGTFTVSNIKSEIISLSYTNGDAEYSFTYDGTKWGYDGDEKLPLDSDIMDSITEAISAIKATKSLDGQDLKSAEFGLDTPLHTIKASCADGSVHVFNIGDYNRHAAGYYLSYEGDSKLYLVSSTFESFFKNEPEDMLLLEKMDTINTDNVTKITAEGAFGKVVLEVTEKADGEDTVKVYTHTNKEGGAVELSEGSARSIIAALASVKLDSCADYYAEDEELETYGLDTENSTKITIAYTVKVTSTSDTTGATSTSKLNRECVYYIGRVTETVDEEESTETSSDTSADTSAADSSDTDEAADSENTQKTVEKTYLILADTHMVFEVNISGADAFFS